VVGALFGLIYILVCPPYVGRGTLGVIYNVLLIFISVILVIYSTVLIHKKQASYFSCVVFLSIAINHIADINPYSFVWNRFLDTMIGIVVGLFINNLRICLRPDRDTLFVSGVDDILVDGNNKISAFSKIELNRMIEDGMRFTLSTIRTPASVLEPLSDINLKYPIIVMDGAALYDVNKNEYLSVFVISPDTTKELVNIIEVNDMYPYINVIIDDTLLIYYKDSPDEMNQELVSSMRSSPYRNYIRREYPCDEKVVYIMMLDTNEKINKIYDMLIMLGYDEILRINKYPSNDNKNYSYIRIYNKNACKERMLSYLKNNSEVTNVMTFGTIEGKYDITIKENSFNEMVKQVRKKYEPVSF
jgi:Predicted hydrolases of the HAD superfamily